VQQMCGRGPILAICTSYDVFLCKELPFGGHNDCSCVEIFIVIFNQD